MNPTAASVSTQQDSLIVVERDLNASTRGPWNKLQLCLDEKEGEYQGYVVTICLPASYLSKVSKVRLQAA